MWYVILSHIHRRSSELYFLFQFPFFEETGKNKVVSKIWKPLRVSPNQKFHWGPFHCVPHQKILLGAIPRDFSKQDTDLLVRKLAIIHGKRPKNQLLGAMCNGSKRDFLLGDTSNGSNGFVYWGTHVMASKFRKPPLFFPTPSKKGNWNKKYNSEDLSKSI